VNSALTHQQQGSMRTRLGLAALTSPNTSNTRRVSFDDIRASMGNVLFPITHGESTSGRTRRESELLGTLLEPVRWEEGERWLPTDRVNAWPSRVLDTVPECEACASASLSLDGFSPSSLQTPSLTSGVSTSTSTSIASRPISWLSFGSRKSTSLINAAQTTPSSTISCFPSVSSHPNPQHSCGCARGQSFLAVDVNDSPLGTGTKTLPVPVLSAANVNSDQGPAKPRARKTNFLTRTWAAMQSPVTSLSSAAVRLQQAYVIATAVTLTATDVSQNVPTTLHSSSETSSGYSGRPPSGLRVQRSDVAKFTSTALHEDRDAVPYVVFYLIELEGMHKFPALEPRDRPAHGPVTPHSPASSSASIPPSYHDADRHIFNANQLHLLSRAQINSWRFRGAPGAMPAQVFCRPELFYRLEPAGSSLREPKGKSSLKWSWRIVWDTGDPAEC
jgi:hypothetical protein